MLTEKQRQKSTLRERRRDRKGRKEGETHRHRECPSTLVPDDLPVTDSKYLLGPKVP